MSVIETSRKIRPSSHNEGDPYRVKCEKVKNGDILQIHITHELDLSIDMLYQISFEELGSKKSIHFMAVKEGETYIIDWLAGIQPTRIR